LTQAATNLTPIPTTAAEIGAQGVAPALATARLAIARGLSQAGVWALYRPAGNADDSHLVRVAVAAEPMPRHGPVKAQAASAIPGHRSQGVLSCLQALGTTTGAVDPAEGVFRGVREVRAGDVFVVPASSVPFAAQPAADGTVPLRVAHAQRDGCAWKIGVAV
jgi:hypothetical protein